MAAYKVVNADQLDADLTTVANKIRAKGGTSAKLAFPSGMVSAIDKLKRFTKVGQIEVGYVAATLDLTSYSNYQNITVDNIYLVPVSFTITQDGTITGGTYNVTKTYSNGVLSAKRDSIPGQVGLAFLMDVYVIE